MSTFRTVFLDVADTLRALTGPEVFDIRTTKLTVISRNYVGGRRSSQAAYVDSELDLPQIYKIRPLKTNEIADSGGKYEQGDIIVGPITPKGDTLGWTEAELQPKPSQDGLDVIYRCTGAHNGDYSRVELRSHKPFSYYLILRRRNDTP